MAKPKAQTMDLNIMQPAPEQRMPASRVELSNVVQTMPERAQRFGSLVHGFGAGAAKLLDPR